MASFSTRRRIAEEDIDSMTNPDLYDRYLVYLERQIAFPRGRGTYRDLLHLMHEKEFFRIEGNDDNRVMDGHDVRIQWLMTLDGSGLQGPVSFLEVLIGMARRLEFMLEENGRDWAWHLLCNLGMQNMRDPLSRYKASKADDIMETVLWRTYHASGAGGFFPLKHPKKDQRKVELWYQLNAYVGELYPGY